MYFSITFKNLLAVTVALLTLVACSSVNGVALDSQAQNIKRYRDAYTFHNVFPLTDEAECVGYPGTATVDGSGVARITEFTSGPNAGNHQLLLRVEGRVTFEADDPEAYPIAYSGSYLEHINERSNRKNLRYSDHLLLTATGTDGSVVKFSFNFHYLLRAGEIQVENYTINCIK